jgi:hypothetical protein
MEVWNIILTVSKCMKMSAIYGHKWLVEAQHPTAKHFGSKTFLGISHAKPHIHYCVNLGVRT